MARSDRNAADIGKEFALLINCCTSGDLVSVYFVAKLELAPTASGFFLFSSELCEIRELLDKLSQLPMAEKI